jgi:hypothetical protein
MLLNSQLLWKRIIMRLHGKSTGKLLDAMNFGEKPWMPEGCLSLLISDCHMEKIINSDYNLDFTFLVD